MKRVEVSGERLFMVFEHLDCNLTDFMRDKKKSENRNLSEYEIKVMMK